MSSTMELVLAVEATAASAWMTAPVVASDHGGTGRRARAPGVKSAHATSRRGKAETRSGGAAGAPQADVGTAIADALSRMPGISALSAVESMWVRAFADSDHTWRVMLAAGGDGARRATAARLCAFAPGVWRCETVCDAPLEAGAPLALSAVFPPALKDALGKPDKLAPSPELSVRRGVWRWSGSGGAVVDIELHDVRDAASDTQGGASSTAVARTEPPAPNASASEPGAAAVTPCQFCQLRLISRIDDTHGSIDASPPSGKAPEQKAAVAAAEPSIQPEPALAALQALFAAAGALADTLPVFPTLTDGYARACGTAADIAPARAARVDLSDAKGLHDAFIGVASGIALQWLGNEAGVREGRDTEFVHQMRVALRRLKTLLKTFPRWADDAWKQTLVPDLDWLGALLGQARDLDVFVDSTLPALAEADIDATAWAPLLTRAAERRDAARAQLGGALRTRRYAALSLAWLRWLAALRFSVGPLEMVDKPLGGYAGKRVRKHYARLIEEPGLTSLTPAERHRRRIEAKRLRYGLEFFESLAARKTRRELAKQLGRIQSVLGDGSDAATALRFLEALDVPPYQHGFARGWCEAVNRWSAIEGERLLRDLGKPKIARHS